MKCARINVKSDDAVHIILDKIVQSVEYKDIPLTVTKEEYVYLLAYIRRIEVQKAQAELELSQLRDIRKKELKELKNV